MLILPIRREEDSERQRISAEFEAINLFQVALTELKRLDEDRPPPLHFKRKCCFKKVQVVDMNLKNSTVWESRPKNKAHLLCSLKGKAVTRYMSHCP